MGTREGSVPSGKDMSESWLSPPLEGPRKGHVSTRREAVCKLGSEPSPEASRAGILISDFKLPELEEHTFLWFQPPCFCYGSPERGQQPQDSPWVITMREKYFVKVLPY